MGVDHHWYGVGKCCRDAANVADKATVGHVRARRRDTDDVTCRGNGNAGASAQGSVGGTSAARERISSDCRVVAAFGVANERLIASGRVSATFGVAKEGECTIGCVLVAGFVKGKRVYSIGSVVVAASIEQKRCSTGGRVVVCGVEIKRSSTNSGIEAAGGDTRQRKCTNCCIPNARGETPKSVVPLRSGEVGIASIGRRDNGLCCLWDDKAGQQERN